MQRRSADLLDVFRSGGGSGSEPPRKEAAPKKPRREKSARTPFQGFFLGPRQLILGVSVFRSLRLLWMDMDRGSGKGA